MALRAIYISFLFTGFVGLTSCISNQLRAVDDVANPGVSGVANIAERGASLQAPENTFAALDKAQDIGAVAVQIDLQLSKDGRVVVFHDEKLDEKTSLTGTVSSHTADEVERADLAPWFAKTIGVATTDVKTDAAQSSSRVETSGTAAVSPSKRAKAGSAQPKRSSKSSNGHSSKRSKKAPPLTNSLTHIVLLDDVFERYGMTYAYDLRLRSSDPKLAEAVWQNVKEYGMESAVTITSDDVDGLTQIRKLDANAQLGYVIDDKKYPDVMGEIQRAKTLGFNEVSIRASLLTTDLVKSAKDAKLAVVARDAVNDDELKKVSRTGVSGIITSVPDHLLKILKTPLFR